MIVIAAGLITFFYFFFIRRVCFFDMFVKFFYLLILVCVCVSWTTLQTPLWHVSTKRVGWDMSARFAFAVHAD